MTAETGRGWSRAAPARGSCPRRVSSAAPVVRLLLSGRGGMTQARQTLGKLGEELACRELERRGYAILARRYRCRGGEVDLVAREGDTIVFVEVKARAGGAFGAAAEAVTAWKRRRLAQLAVDYLARHRLTGRPCRFDVVAVHVEDGRAAIEIYPDAFAFDG